MSQQRWNGAARGQVCRESHIGGASAKGVWDALFILYVIWPALLLYQITKQAGERYAPITVFTHPGVDHQLVFGRALHWKVGDLFALKDAIDVASSLPVSISRVRSVRDEATCG